MTAWQYFAGVGLAAALCPLHGHVEVAGDGHGRGARVDLCVPAGAKPGRPFAAPPHGRPSLRAAVPGPLRPTVRHPGSGPLPAPAGAALPRLPGLPGLPGPTPKAGDAPSQPPPAGPGAESVAAPAVAEAVVPAAVGATAAPARAFHVRSYRSSALARRGPDGLSTVMLMVVVTTPAVLAAAALRPRSKSRG